MLYFGRQRFIVAFVINLFSVFNRYCKPRPSVHDFVGLYVKRRHFRVFVAENLAYIHFVVAIHREGKLDLIAAALVICGYFH